MEKTKKRNEVNHRFSTSYHPQISGQVENRIRALKRILEKTVKDNPAIWSRKLDDILWAFRTAFKTPTGTTPYKLIYGKNCHLPFVIKHRAFWALKNYNPDLIAAGEKRMFQLHELDEFRHQAYENSHLYKARTKVWHDRKLKMRKEFKHGNKDLQVTYRQDCLDVGFGWIHRHCGTLVSLDVWQYQGNAIDSAHLILVIEGWSRLPPFQYQLAQSEKVDKKCVLLCEKMNQESLGDLGVTGKGCALMSWFNEIVFNTRQQLSVFDSLCIDSVSA
ncbi:reverse transcriptase domain-containing protein [Tanacetum coccineum]